MSILMGKGITELGFDFLLFSLFLCQVSDNRMFCVLSCNDIRTFVSDSS
jgi:hypothetical protein